ncbi:MAG: hypothetical protein NTV65_10335 [Proteobacteria bacterium]|jgi:hypothetical protein|nr:hypothetical protein [Pseudomonadota bacterium]
MSGNVGGPPDPFSLSPLLSLLPSCGNLTRLENLVSSLFARHEKVETLREEAKSKELERRYTAEEAMLRQILDWLAVKPMGGE